MSILEPVKNVNNLILVFCDAILVMPNILKRTSKKRTKNDINQEIKMNELVAILR